MMSSGTAGVPRWCTPRHPCSHAWLTVKLRAPVQRQRHAVGQNGQQGHHLKHSPVHQRDQAAPEHAVLGNEPHGCVAQGGQELLQGQPHTQQGDGRDGTRAGACVRGRSCASGTWWRHTTQASTDLGIRKPLPVVQILHRVVPPFPNGLPASFDLLAGHGRSQAPKHLWQEALGLLQMFACVRMSMCVGG